MKTIYRVEVVVYEIDQEDPPGTNPNGHGGFEQDEDVQDVVFEEDVFDCDTREKAVELAELIVEKAGKL